MRKLALMFLLFFFVVSPLSAQVRDLKGRIIDDATSDCEAEKLLRLADAGLVPEACLPTSTVELPWFEVNPVVAPSSVAKHFLPSKQAGRVTNVYCETDTGTVDLNFDSRAKGALGTPGTDLHTSEIVATSTGVTVTTFAGDDENAANQAWVLSISATSGSPTLLSCWMTVERL